MLSPTNDKDSAPKLNVGSQTILITGCGGDIAISVARLVRELVDGCHLIGTDIHSDHPASVFFDTVRTVPRADAADYTRVMAKLVEEQGVDVVIPMSEAELKVFLAHDALERFHDAKVISASRFALETGLDKLKTARLIEESGLAAPWTVVVGESEPNNTPCILKARSGQGSKSVSIVQTSEQAARYSATRRGDIWQELLGDADHEFTCGLFRAPNVAARSIAIRRKLQGGLTGSGEVVHDDAISEYLAKIADALNLRGSINVQLRMTDRGPVAFEINPRFSSTVLFRHRMGFQDFLWTLQDVFAQPISSYTPPAAGTRIYRVANEVILPG